MGMRYDVYFICNYWRVHWHKAVIMLSTYVLLIIFVFTSFSMVRTELRRVYFDNFNHYSAELQGYSSDQGAYHRIFWGLSEEDADGLANEPCIGMSGKLYTDTYLGNESCAYTYGAYMDDTACELSGIRMIEGNFPKEAGEAAISECAMANMGIEAGIGDMVTLTEYDSDMDITGMRTFRLAGVFEDDGTRGRWETDSLSVDEDVFEPVILLSSKDMDTANSLLSVMIRWVGIHDSVAELQTEEDYNPYRQVEWGYLEKAKYGRGFGGYDSSYFADSLNMSEKAWNTSAITAEDYTGVLKSAKSRIYAYVCIIATVVLALSLICALLAALPGLLRSMELLHQSGCPLWRLRRMLVAQWVFFTLAGSVLGFLAAIGVYETLLQVQYHVFGLGIYRAWQSEWGICQITYSPAVMGVVSTLAASALAFGIPVIFLKRMLFQRSKKPFRIAFARIGGFHTDMRKIFRQPSIQMLQVLSLLLVLVVSCTAMMFFSTKNKKNVDNPQVIAQGKTFETDPALDMRRYGIDCTIENTNPQSGDVIDLVETAGLKDGLEEQVLEELSQSGKFKECYAWTEIGSLFGCYQKGERAPGDIQLFNLLQDAKESFGVEQCDIYDIFNPVIASDAMILDTGLDIERLDQGAAAVLYQYKEPFRNAHTIPCFSAYGRIIDKEWELSDKLMFDLAIAEKVQLSQEFCNERPLLYGIWDGMFQTTECGYIVVFSHAGVEKLGLHYKNYNHTYLSYAEGTTDADVKEMIGGVNLSRSHLEVSTLTRLQERYDRMMLKEYVVVYTIFGLFILLALTGYIQAMQVQVLQRRRQIAALRALGGSKQRVRGGIMLQLMKAPVISCALGAAGVVFVKWLLKWRYDICESLYKASEAYNMDPTNPAGIQIVRDYNTQKIVFLTQYEMWKVPVAGLFIVLAALALISILWFSYIIASRAADAPILPEREE